jgi:hypothetical protein
VCSSDLLFIYLFIKFQNYRGNFSSGLNSVIDFFGVNDDTFDQNLQKILLIGEITSFQPSYITSSLQNSFSSTALSSSSSSSSFSSSQHSTLPKFLPINIIPSNGTISDKSNIPISAITREVPSSIDHNSLDIAVMHNNKLNSLSKLDASDKEFLSKLAPFFDVLYNKCSPSQRKMLDDTINNLPTNLFSDYTLPPRRKIGSDIKAYSIQKHVLAFAQELTLIFRTMKEMNDNRNNITAFNKSLEKETQILVLARYTLARIGTLASLDRLELTNPKIARYLCMSNKEPIFTPAMQKDWEILKKAMG